MQQPLTLPIRSTHSLAGPPHHNKCSCGDDATRPQGRLEADIRGAGAARNAADLQASRLRAEGVAAQQRLEQFAAAQAWNEEELARWASAAAQVEARLTRDRVQCCSGVGLEREVLLLVNKGSLPSS